MFQENYLDSLPMGEVRPFVDQYVSYVESVYNKLYKDILASGDITEQQREQLHVIAKEFASLFVPV